MRDLALENPIRAIREISHDITGRKTVRLANGRELSALRHPARVPRARPSTFVEREGMDGADPRSRCSTSGAGPSRPSRPATSSRVDTEIDWVIKYRLIDALHREARPVALRPADRCRSTSPTTTSTGGAGSSTCSSGAGRPARVCTRHRDLPGQGAARRRRPGPSCAATSSGAAQEHRRDFTVDWVHLKLNDQAQRTVLCKDPFAAEDSRVDEAHRQHVTTLCAGCGRWSGATGAAVTVAGPRSPSEGPSRVRSSRAAIAAVLTSLVLVPALAACGRPTRRPRRATTAAPTDPAHKPVNKPGGPQGARRHHRHW